MVTNKYENPLNNSAPSPKKKKKFKILFASMNVRSLVSFFISFRKNGNPVMYRTT